MEILKQAADIYPALRCLIEKTSTNFVAMGVSFDRSLKHLAPTIEKALERGVQFQYVTLDAKADLNSIATQFGQTVDELRTEIAASEAVLQLVAGFE
jgi:hypothetical protein